MSSRPLTRTAAEFCSGAGGLSLGLRNSGFWGVWACEMDKHAASSHRANFPEVPLIETLLEPGDVAELPDIPNLDLLAGGIPCQPFSNAGRSLGKYDPRDGFPVFLALLRKWRPKALLIENVKGLTFKKHRLYLERIEADLDEAGYVSARKILNAADYGTPQRRERLFIVGFRDDLDWTSFSWPEPTHSVRALAEAKWDTGTYWKEHGVDRRPKFAADLDPCADCGEPWCSVCEEHFDVCSCPGPHSDHAALPSAVETRALKKPEDDRLRWLTVRDAIRDLLGTAEDVPNHEPEWPSDLVQRRIEAGEVDTILRKHPPRDLDETSNTVEANLHRGGYYGMVRLDDGSRRRMTPRELARLQGWPDHFQLHGPKTAQYRQVGNGVPEPLGRVVGLALQDAFDSIEKEAV